jgi:hypothetical protein
MSNYLFEREDAVIEREVDLLDSLASTSINSWTEGSKNFVRSTGSTIFRAVNAIASGSIYTGNSKGFSGLGKKSGVQ